MAWIGVAGIVGDRVRRRAARDRDVAGLEAHRLTLVGDDQGEPRTAESTASGASSWIRSAHGGSKLKRSRNAPRARGPSRSPATASMRVDDDVCIRAFQLWIVYDFDGSIQPMNTLIIGAAGKTGRRIVERLEARNVAVRPASRATGFDWNDPATWPAMVEGIDAAYISYHPDITVPGAPEAIAAFSKVAAAHGVKRLVLLSGRGESEAERAERLVQAAGTEWTIVRCSWFAQNFSEAFMVDGVLAGEVAVPAGDVPEPFVDVEDIADVAVAALTEDGHHGQVYELDRAAGADASTTRWRRSPPRPAARSASRPVPVDAFTAGMREAGVPDVEAALVAWLFTEVLDGRNAEPQDGVRRALGRAPRDFGEYARRTAASGGLVAARARCGGCARRRPTC